MQGYVNLHRKMLDWEWYQDGPTKDVFIHLLLTANYKKSKYKGVDIEAGQVVIGRKSLAKALGLGEQQVRTALEHLKSTNDITIKSTNKFSVVTIVNWPLYQFVMQPLTNNLTNDTPNNQPTTNQQLTTSKKEKKKKRKNILIKSNEEYVDNYFDMTLEERREYLRRQSQLALSED